MTRPGLEPTIYRTGGEHANHCATDAVSSKMQMLFEPWFEIKTIKKKNPQNIFLIPCVSKTHTKVSYFTIKLLLLLLLLYFTIETKQEIIKIF